MLNPDYKYSLKVLLRTDFLLAKLIKARVFLKEAMGSEALSFRVTIRVFLALSFILSLRVYHKFKFDSIDL